MYKFLWTTAIILFAICIPWLVMMCNVNIGLIMLLVELVIVVVFGLACLWVFCKAIPIWFVTKVVKWSWYK